MRNHFKKFFNKLANILIAAGQKLLLRDKIGKRGQQQISDEESIISNLSSFRDLKVSEVLIPRTDIVGLEHSADLQQVKEKFIKAAHTRIPVYQENLDDIIGFIHVKDFISYIDGTKAFHLSNVMRKLIYCPRSTKCVDLLAKMRSETTNIAVVLDEYGGTEGIVVIENLLELIVGEIRDEHDQIAKNLIQKIGEKVYIIDARAGIQEVEEILEIGISEEGEYETFGGFILSYLDRIPEKGERLIHPAGLEIEVLEVEPRKIKKVKVVKLDQPL